MSRTVSGFTGRGEAYLVLLLLAAGVFLAATVAPYRVDSDTGFQLRALQQWSLGQSPSPGIFRLPQPEDLSRDSLVWSSWWPPGLPFLYAPLAAAGLPLAADLRLTSFLLFLAGGVGWMRFADGLGLTRLARLLYAVSVAAYAVTIGGAATLRSADNLTFAAAPWLALLALRLARSEPSHGMLLLCGVAFGATYFLKYTLFITALALAVWLATRLFLRMERSRTARLLGVAALGLGIALPVAAFAALDAWQSGFLAGATGQRSLWQVVDPRLAGPLPLALGLAGAPGLGLFQSHVWITHLVYFSDRSLFFLRSLDPYQRILLQALAGTVGTLALVWALSRVRGRLAACQLSLAVTAVAVFYAALAALSLAVAYNYLAHEPRHAVGVMPLLQPFVLSSLLALAGRQARRPARVVAWAVLGAFFAVPILFAASVFGLQQVRGRLLLPYTPSSTGLYAPEISPRNVPEVQASIASLLSSPSDVVVLAGPLGWGGFLMWLELPWRTMPIQTFTLPLGQRYGRAADLRSTVALRTSRPMRVVLVASLSLQQQGWVSRLQRRFPQAKEWTPAPAGRDAGVGIWFSDLEIRR